MGGGEVWLWFTLQSCDVPSPSVTESLYFSILLPRRQIVGMKVPSVRRQCHTLLLFVVRLRPFVFLFLQGSFEVVDPRSYLLFWQGLRAYRHLIWGQTHLLWISYHSTGLSYTVPRGLLFQHQWKHDVVLWVPNDLTKVVTSSEIHDVRGSVQGLEKEWRGGSKKDEVVYTILLTNPPYHNLLPAVCAPDWDRRSTVDGERHMWWGLLHPNPH
jgi:hypothetical protein